MYLYTDSVYPDCTIVVIFILFYFIHNAEIFFCYVYLNLYNRAGPFQLLLPYVNRWVLRPCNTSIKLQSRVACPGAWMVVTLHKKWSFPLRICLLNVTNLQKTANLVTFTEEILNGKLHFLCSVSKS